MRIYLQTQPQAGEAPKYYQLQLEQDLFAGRAVGGAQPAGQPGGRPSVKREQFLELVLAQEAMEKARDAQLKRGFRVMFSQGAGAPIGLRTGTDD